MRTVAAILSRGCTGFRLLPNLIGAACRYQRCAVLTELLRMSWIIAGLIGVALGAFVLGAEVITYFLKREKIQQYQHRVRIAQYDF